MLALAAKAKASDKAIGPEGVPEALRLNFKRLRLQQVLPLSLLLVKTGTRGCRPPSPSHLHLTLERPLIAGHGGPSRPLASVLKLSAMLGRLRRLHAKLTPVPAARAGRNAAAYPRLLKLRAAQWPPSLSLVPWGLRRLVTPLLRRARAVL